MQKANEVCESQLSCFWNQFFMSTANDGVLEQIITTKKCGEYKGTQIAGNKICVYHTYQNWQVSLVVLK